MGALGGIIGAKLYYLALHWQDVAAAPLHELANRAGLIWYGGLSAMISPHCGKLSGGRLRPGQLFGLYLGLASVERVVIEFVRAKDDRFVFGLTTSQMFAILGVTLAALLWRLAKRRGLSRANETTEVAARVPVGREA